MAAIKDINELEKSIMRKKIILLLSLANMFVLVLVAFYAVSSWDILEKKDEPSKEIQVSGEGIVLARPNIVTFTATVITDAPRVKDAQAENTNRSNAVISFLKQSGVADKDMKTVGYTVSPQYQYDTVARCFNSPCPVHSPRIISYQVRHTLEIKVRNLDSADSLLEGVVSAGANEVGSLVFDVDNKDAARAEARKKAIADAKKKAAVLAKDLGIRLTEITQFSESSGIYPPPMYAAKSFEGMGGDMAQPAPEVKEGEQQIRSNVTISYKFR